MSHSLCFIKYNLWLMLVTGEESNPSVVEGTIFFIPVPDWLIMHVSCFLFRNSEINV